MSKVLELKEKRAKAWDAAKAFLDGKSADGNLSAEDAAVYDKMEADVVSLGKDIERLERQQAIDIEMSTATSSPIKNKPTSTVGGETKTGRASSEYKIAYNRFLRNRMNYDVENALSIGVGEGGGYLVPDEYEKTLVDALQEENIFRQLARVIKTENGDRKIPIIIAKGAAAWVDEGGEIPESDDKFGIISLSTYKLATAIRVSNELLNDSVFSIEEYIAKEFARRIGVAEEDAFINGDGVGKPTGILADTGGAEVGITTAKATIELEDILDLFHSLKSPYRKKAVFLMNDATVKAIRKLKDANGQFLWQPSIKEGAPDTILNSPVKTSAYMPLIGPEKKAIVFGDLSYYWIADRQGRAFQRLNELYATTQQVGFLAFQRVDGKIILPEAIKALQMKA